jgi:hypothetical protein
MALQVPGAKWRTISALQQEGRPDDILTPPRILDSTKRRWQFGRHMPHMLCDRRNRNERIRVADNRAGTSM